MDGELHSDGTVQMMMDALRKEGLREDQITVLKDRVIRDENGFVSWRVEHGYPYITHFLVYPDKRKSMAFLSLYLKFKREIAARGYTAFIAEVIPGKGIFDRFIAKLGCNKPYAQVDGCKYYFVCLR